MALKHVNLSSCFIMSISPWTFHVNITGAIRLTSHPSFVWTWWLLLPRRSPMNTGICLRYGLYSQLHCLMANNLWLMVICTRSWQFRVRFRFSHNIRLVTVINPNAISILRSRCNIILFSSHHRFCFDKLNFLSLIDRSGLSIFDKNWRIHIWCLSALLSQIW